MSKFTSNLTWRLSMALILFASLMGNTSLNSAKAQAPNTWINEIHYDNDGNDTEEGIEVVIENKEAFDITALAITFYNGTDGSPYNTIYFSEDDWQTSMNEFDVYAQLVPEIQNGDPDGIALSYNGFLIQFISYGGTLPATGGIAAGVTANDIGVKEGSETPIGFSLQLTGIGNRYATFEWVEPTSNSFGAVNPGQELRQIDGPQPVRALRQTYIASDKVQIEWTKPIGIHGEDWDGVLLFASKEEPNQIDLENKDFTDFSGDTKFGGSAPIGNSYTIARKETDADGTVVVTGLEKGVSYHFIAYTYYNISENDNDLFSDASDEVLVLPKVADVSTLSPSPLSEKVRLTWENAMGQVDDWWAEIMIVAGEAPITAVPGQKDYIADNVLVEGEAIAPGEHVVYMGKGDQAVVYGLTNGKSYYFKVFVRYDNGENFDWSSGMEVSCTPADNTKLWTGEAGTSQFMDANNWEPKGVPGPGHQVILDHQYQTAAYDVVFPSGGVPVQLNSLKIVPGNNIPITVKLVAEVNEEAALTLLDEEAPLVIGDHGIFINNASRTGLSLEVPNGNILLAEEGKYVHSSASSHADLLTKIKTAEGIIPGTIAFNVSSVSNYFTSLSGRSFHKLVFASSNNITYEVSGSQPVLIAEELLIQEGATLNLSALNAGLILKGDLILDGGFNFNETILFNGTEEQILSSNKATSLALNKIEINKPGNNLSLLNTDLKLVSSLALVQGNLITNEQHVLLDYTESNPTITNSPNARLVGNLEVIREVGKSEVAFPNAGLIIGAGEEALGAVRATRKTGPEAVIVNGENKSIQKIWEIQAAAPLSKPRSLKFFWEETDEGDLEMESAKVWQESEGSWFPLGDFQDGALRTITVTAHSLTSFTITDDNNVLPITLVSFSVTQKDHQAVLKWITASETNNKGFEIQKSNDGNNFYPIGFEKGQGNSVVQHTYQFIDPSFNENAYYRLKQIDLNGKVSFSSIQYLPKLASKSATFKISPNPLSNNVPLSISSSFPLNNLVDYCILYNSHGKVVYKGSHISFKRLQEELNALKLSLPAGLYVLQFQSMHKNQKLKLLKE